MNDDIAIKIDKVYKDFKLPHEKVNSVKGLFTKGFRNTKSSEKQHALKNISFEVKKGEFFGIVGRNGGGKSTLLKMIAGIYQPTKGSVKVAGKLVPFIELGVGFNPELTGRENVFLNGAILGFTPKQVEANYKKIVEFAELEEFMDQKLKNYSSGMQVRLAFACATMAEADVLLIDEVLAVGDADFQRKCFNYFKQLKKTKTTVVFVTHDMSAVREYCDRVVLIDDSKVDIIGEPEDIAMAYIKLFSNNSTIDDSKNQRWGTGQIKYLKKPEVEISAEGISIATELISKIEQNGVVLGFLIENVSGEPVIGTNSLIIQNKPEKVLMNETVKSIWSFENILSEGNYRITVSITSIDGATVYDWWRDVVSFKIINDHNTPYNVSPKVDLKITQGQSR